MTSSRPFRRRAAALSAALLLPAAAALAAPGAHGPDGGHDGAARHGPAAASGAPRLETHGDRFELVATLVDGEMSILVDRYASNEPVLGASVAVAVAVAVAGAVGADAGFHADHGDYAVADAAFLRAVSAPGKHALVFTVNDGEATERLHGLLEVGAPPPHAHGDDDLGEILARWRWAALVAGALLLAGAAALRLRRRRRPAGRGSGA